MSSWMKKTIRNTLKFPTYYLESIQSLASLNEKTLLTYVHRGLLKS